MKNKWKTGFFLLVGFNVLIGIILLSLILVPADKNEKIQQTVPDNKNVSFQVKSNKADLNVLINQYIKKKRQIHRLNTVFNCRMKLNYTVHYNSSAKR